MSYATIEDRVDRLEALFGQLMAQLAMSDKKAEERHQAAQERHIAAEERNRAAEERMTRFEQEMHGINITAEERNKAAEERNKAAEERMTCFEQYMQASDKAAKEMMAEFKNEMRQSKRDLDKKWGDLANKMGTMVEDIVAPNLPRIAKEQFQLEEPLRFFTRSYAAKVGNPSSRREFDTIIFYSDSVIVNETKSHPNEQHVESFVAMLKEFGEYYPEQAGKRIIPIFASLSLPESIINLLTKKCIYGLAMGEDTMELVNHDCF